MKVLTDEIFFTKVEELLTTEMTKVLSMKVKLILIKIKIWKKFLTDKSLKFYIIILHEYFLKY